VPPAVDLVERRVEGRERRVDLAVENREGRGDLDRVRDEATEEDAALAALGCDDVVRRAREIAEERRLAVVRDDRPTVRPDEIAS